MKEDKKSFTVQEIKAKMEHYCAYQDRCHFDVEKKLREFFIIPEARDEIILSLMNDRFLNEERFAKSYARGKFRSNSWGKIKIKHGLKAKHISDFLINTGLKEINDEEYFERAEKLISAKLQSTSAKNDYELRAKVTAYMQRKGYEFEIINEIINNLLSE